MIYALAAFVGLYALQATYSADLAVALKNVCLFYAPFAVLLRLLGDVDWTAERLRTAFWLISALAVLFAVVGFYEYATGHLLLSNAKVQEANDLKPYFRVNSLFFDPNIYGRFEALTMIALAATLLWSRSRQTVLLVAAALGVLWAGLVLSLSQSSFGALLGGLAVLAALRWSPKPVLAVTAALVAAGVAVIVLAPGAVQIDTGSQAALDKATSGRFDLVRGALSMTRDRPVWGYGSGSFAVNYRKREGVRSLRVAAVSHTIPLTVAAEQGVIGLAAYLALIAASLALVFDGLLARLRPAEAVGIADVAAAAVAAAFCALVLHTLVYAAFLEDPLSWTLLALAAGLAAQQRCQAPLLRGSRPERAQRCRGLRPAPRTLDAVRNRRKLLVAAAAIAVLLMAGAAVAYFTVVKTPGDISNPDVPFLAPAPTPAPKTAQKPAKPANFRWPNYGYTKDHRRAFDPPKPLRGPWRTKWKHKASALTEFPPSIAQNRILQLSDDARLVSRNLETGKKIWDRKLGKLSASSPAIEDGRVYVTLLNGAQGSGRVVCLRFDDGKILWSKALSSRSESSPLVDSGRVFFGSEGGTLYALDAKSGKQDWTYRAGGAVKGSPTLSDGVLFFGAYGGSVHAVRARDGAKVWTSGAGHGLVRSGNFYATAAVAFGRVYIGATDGRAYSFSAKDGRVAWAHQTGRYVYSSAAVKDVAGRRADGLLRLLRRHVLRARRQVREGALDAQLGRQDLRLADDRGRHRVLRRPRAGDHARAQGARRQARVPLSDRRLRPDHLRRRAPVPDRQPVAVLARAAARLREAPEGQGGQGQEQEGARGPARLPRLARAVPPAGAVRAADRRA